MSEKSKSMKEKDVGMVDKLMSTPSLPVTGKGRGRSLRSPRYFYHVETRGTCLLCYRDCLLKHGKEGRLYTKKRKQESSALFCKLILRHMNLEFRKHIAIPSEVELKKKRLNKIRIELCEDCSLLATNFCKLYEELEVAKMRLQACVRMIGNIMTSAGRIPSRIKAYQERMREISTDDVPGGGVNKKSKSTEKTITLVQNFRNELIRKCVGENKSALPCVMLTRCRKVNTSKGPSWSVEPLPAPSAKNLNVARKPQSLPLSLSLSSSHQKLENSQISNHLIAYALRFAAITLLADFQIGVAIKIKNESLAITHSPTPREVVPATAGDTEKSCPSTPTTERVASSASASSSRRSTEEGMERLNAQPDQQSPFSFSNCGTTIMLPQVFKTELLYVDESIDAEMCYEDSTMVAFLNTGDSSSFPENTPCEMEVEDAETVGVNLNDRICRDCKIQLGSRGELEKHRVIIHKLHAYVECPSCRTMLPNYFALKRHREENENCAITETDEELELETIAKPIFPSSSTIRGNKFCALEGCMEVFARKESLQLHYKTHGSFSCSFCQDKFDKAHELALHETGKHSEYSGYKCMRCSFHVGGQYKYLTHFLSEHCDINLYEHRCEICRKGFLKKSKEELQRHFQTYHYIEGKPPEEILRCTMLPCEAYFISNLQLIDHLTQIHHVGQEAKVTCSICNKPFLNNLLLHQHTFKEHENLQDHEVRAKLKRKFPTLKPTKKFKCEYCALTFKSLNGLKNHRIKHQIKIQENANVNNANANDPATGIQDGQGEGQSGQRQIMEEESQQSTEMELERQSESGTSTC